MCITYARRRAPMAISTTLAQQQHQLGRSETHQHQLLGTAAANYSLTSSQGGNGTAASSTSTSSSTSDSSLLTAAAAGAAVGCNVSNGHQARGCLPSYAQVHSHSLPGLHAAPSPINSAPFPSSPSAASAASGKIESSLLSWPTTTKSLTLDSIYDEIEVQRRHLEAQAQRHQHQAVQRAACAATTATAGAIGTVVANPHDDGDKIRLHPPSSPSSSVPGSPKQDPADEEKAKEGRRKPISKKAAAARRRSKKSVPQTIRPYRDHSHDDVDVIEVPPLILPNIVPSSSSSSRRMSDIAAAAAAAELAIASASSVPLTPRSSRRAPPPSKIASADASAEAASATTSSSVVDTLAFPHKLHYLLTQIDNDSKSHIIGWQPHGRSFKIRNSKQFATQILEKYFKMNKVPSFQRQLNLYGFVRITKGPDRGGYYHEYFLKGKPELTTNIHRTRIKGTGVRQASNPDAEPNFYRMEPVEGCYIPQDAVTQSYIANEGSATTIDDKKKEVATTAVTKVAKGKTKVNKATAGKADKNHHQRHQHAAPSKVSSTSSTIAPIAPASASFSAIKAEDDEYATRTFLPFDGGMDSCSDKRNGSVPMTMEHIVYQKAHCNGGSTNVANAANDFYPPACTSGTMPYHHTRAAAAPAAQYQLQRQSSDISSISDMYRAYLDTLPAVPVAPQSAQSFLEQNAASLFQASEIPTLYDCGRYQDQGGIVTPTPSTLVQKTPKQAAIDAVMANVEPIKFRRDEAAASAARAAAAMALKEQGLYYQQPPNLGLQQQLDPITSSEQAEKDEIDRFFKEIDEDLAFADEQMELLDDDVGLGLMLEAAIDDM